MNNKLHQDFKRMQMISLDSGDYRVPGGNRLDR